MRTLVHPLKESPQVLSTVYLFVFYSCLESLSCTYSFLDAIASLEEHWVSASQQVSKSVSQSLKCKLRRNTLLYEYI